MSELPIWVDIGLNLTHKSFQSDVSRVLERARAVGVEQMVLTGTSVEGSHSTAQLAHALSPCLYSTAGIHPHHAAEFTDDSLVALSELCERDEVVAVGECGLDFYRNFSPRDAQERCFRAQLRLAAETGRPVFLHERDAFEAFAAILKDFMADLPAAVVHCFTGSDLALDQYLDLGCSIGITGWVCDERRGGGLRELVPTIPLDRLMIETDAPFLLPRDLRPKPKSTRNEPCHLPHIGQVMAGLCGLTAFELAEATTRNAQRFFGLPSEVTREKAV